MEQKILHENELFRGLTLAGETVENATFIECEFIDCVFLGVELRRCTFRACKLTRCRIEAPKGRETGVQGMELDGCFLSGVEWCEFLPGNRYAELFTSLRGCTLRYNTFSQMKFPKFDFSDTQIIESMFAECDLSEAKLRGTRLDRTEFFRCDITNADFRESTGYKVDVLTCKVKGRAFPFPRLSASLEALA